MENSISYGSSGNCYQLGLLDKYKDTIELRWEFLKRKETYQKDYKRCFGNLSMGHAASKINFFNKHGIEYPVNPNRSFKDIWKEANSVADEEGRISWTLNTMLLRELDVYDENIKHDLFGVWDSKLLNTDISLQVNNKGLKLLKEGGIIHSIPRKYKKTKIATININLDAKRWIINKQVNNVVKFWQNQLGIKDGKKKPRTKLKYGLRYYRECLLVFDAYQKWPRDWKRIARAVYKTDNLRNRDKARHQYKAANKLIKGGIRNVVL